MTPNDFNSLREMLKKTSGLVLNDDKQYLIESRLGPVAKRLKFDSVDDLVAKWRGGDALLEKNIVEAMTINESFFFRDKTPFDNFKNVILPNLVEQKKDSRQLRIWSAAASTGQEAYSLAMILQEHKHLLEGWRIDILGTDLSSQALEKARTGLYSQFEVQRGMPVTYLVKNFKQVGSMWQLDPKIVAMVQYKQFNLLKPFTIFGLFDVIFCRNVLIYFDKDTKTDVLQRLQKQGNPGCYLVLGASETLVGLNNTYQPVDNVRGLYQLPTSDARQTAVRSPALARTAATGS